MKKLILSDFEIEKRISRMARNYGYYAEQESRNTFLRNTLTQEPYKYVSINSTNIDNANSLIREYVREFPNLKGLPVTHDECVKMIEGFNWQDQANITLLKRSVMFCPSSELEKLYLEKLAPDFFKTYEDGQIILVKTSIKYADRATFIRLLFTLSDYPEVVGQSAFKVLSKWNQIDPQYFLKVIINLLLYLYYPFILGTQASNNAGYLTFIFLPRNPFKHQRDKRTATWLNYIGTEADFAGEGIDIDYSSSTIQIHPRVIHHKYVFNQVPPFDEVIDLIVWGIKVSNKLAMKLYDITNFLKKDSQTIEPLYALQYAHSIMHILRDASMLISNDLSYQNKAITFRIADILSSLARHRTGGSREETEFFKNLFRCDTGKILVKDILDSSNAKPIRDYSKIIEDIYENLRKAIVNSIWVRSRIYSRGVLIRNNKSKVYEAIEYDRFCGELIRELRNTHHGYFRKRSYISLSDGNTTDDFPTLALGWVLALLELPENLIGNPS